MQKKSEKFSTTKVIPRTGSWRSQSTYCAKLHEMTRNENMVKYDKNLWTDGRTDTLTERQTDKQTRKSFLGLAAGARSQKYFK